MIMQLDLGTVLLLSMQSWVSSRPCSPHRARCQKYVQKPVFGENYSSFESSTSGLSNHVNDLYSNHSEAKSAKILGEHSICVSYVFYMKSTYSPHCIARILVLKKIVLHENCVGGTILMIQLTRNSPTCGYIGQNLLKWKPR